MYDDNGAPMGPSAGPIARRRLPPEERRAAILIAAASAFAEADYDAVSVAEIAKRVGVSEPLVFRYFCTKGVLHAAVVQRWADELAAREDEAIAAVPSGSPTRERVRAALEVRLDDAAAGADWWLDPVSLPADSLAVLTAAREAQVDRLRALLPCSWPRHDYALAAYPGFIAAAARAWVARGCPASDRDHVIQAALGALEGARGDWGG